MDSPTDDEEDASALISDDSSFYGDDDLRAELKARADSFDPSFYWKEQHDQQLSAIAYKARMSASQPPAIRTHSSAFNVYADEPSARQISESVPEFLARLPPRTTKIGDVGPWVYISYFYTRPNSEDCKSFKERGKGLLEKSLPEIKALQTESDENPKGEPGEELKQLRGELETSIFELARRTGCTSGKWMLFPPPEDVDRVWGIVAEKTAAGELGFAAKVGTDDGEERSKKSPRLICMYTKDYADKKDVKRVLEKLLEEGLARRIKKEGKAIYYKADCYTHLDIMSRNKWGLKPTLYSSFDLIKEKV